MAKVLSNQEIAPPRDSARAELEQFSSRPRRLNQAVSASPVISTGQRMVERRPRFVADEGQSASKAAEWKHTAKEEIEEVTAAVSW